MPTPPVQLKVAVGPGSEEPLSGPLQMAAVCASTANELDVPVTLTGTAGFKGSVTAGF